MSNIDKVKQLIQTGDAKNIELGLLLIQGGAVSPLEVCPNLYEVYDFLCKYNQVNKVSTDIEKLKQLMCMEWLYLEDLRLTEVPNFNLPNLEWLYLKCNELTTVPNFERLPNLKGLQLAKNQLTSVYTHPTATIYQNTQSSAIAHK